MQNRSTDDLFGLYDLFVGGAFSNAAIFALGIMPYISASIIIQLMGAVVPYFQKLQREGEEGRKKITQLTRYGTV
jgi:preprotein translocase subunit SecY